MLFERQTGRVADADAIATQTLVVQQISRLAESFAHAPASAADERRMKMLVRDARANQARIVANTPPAARRELARAFATYADGALRMGEDSSDAHDRDLVSEGADLTRALATSEQQGIAGARQDDRFIYALAAGALASLVLMLVSVCRSLAQTRDRARITKTHAATAGDLTDAQLARMEELYLIVASSGTEPSVQIERALAFASRSLAYEWAALVEWVDGEEPTISAVLGEDVTDSLRDCRLEREIALEASRAGAPVTFRIDRLPQHLAPLASASRPYAWRYCAAYVFPGDFNDRVPHCALFLGSRTARAETLSEADRQLLRLVGTLVSSSSRNKRHQKRLDDLAYADPLTGIANRANLSEQLEETIARAERTNCIFALHYIDLDGFKRVNDEDGHAVGDEVLKLAATRMAKVLRGQETIARIGGDEFVVLQTTAEHASDAAEVARRIIERLARPFTIGGRKYTIGGSIGVAMFPEHGRSAAELLQHADEALYTSKRKGKGCANFYTPLPSSDANSVT